MCDPSFPVAISSFLEILHSCYYLSLCWAQELCWSCSQFYYYLVIQLYPTNASSYLRIQLGVDCSVTQCLPNSTLSSRGSTVTFVPLLSKLKPNLNIPSHTVSCLNALIHRFNSRLPLHPTSFAAYLTVPSSAHLRGTALLPILL